MRTHWLSKVSGFSARSMKQVTQHSSSGCPRTQGSAKWRPDPKETNSDAVWELLPIVTGHSEPEWGDTWTIQEDSSFHPTEVPSAKLPKVPWSPTPLSQGKPCMLGPYKLGLTSVKSSHFIATMSWKDWRMQNKQKLSMAQRCKKRFQKVKTGRSGWTLVF